MALDGRFSDLYVDRLHLANTQVVTTAARLNVAAAAPAASIDDAETEHGLADTFDDEEAEAALNALGATVNAILAVLRDRGMIEPPAPEE